MKRIFFLLIFLIIFISSASAQSESLGTFKQLQAVNLVQNCFNSTFSNITRISYPNSSFAINSQTAMTKNGDNYNYSFTNTLINGQYLVYGSCDESNSSTNWAYDFNITPTGQVLDTSRAILLFVALFISCLIFGLTLWGGISIPNRQTKNPMTGYVIAVDNIKYVKMLLVAVSYLVLMLIMYFAWIISYGFLDLDFLANIFKFGFYFMVATLIPLFVVSVYILVANAVRDNKISEMLSSGLKFKDNEI